MLLGCSGTCVPHGVQRQKGVMICGKGKFITRSQYHHTSSVCVHSQACSLRTATSQFHRGHLASHIIIITTATYIYRKTRQPIFLNSWQRIAPSSTSRTSVLITKGTRKSGVFKVPVNRPAKVQEALSGSQTCESLASLVILEKHSIKSQR